MKRILELRKLSEDHHHGLALARRARIAARGQGGLSVALVWKEVEEKLENELEPHFRIEERYIAAPLAALGETELIRRFEEDHRLLRGYIGERGARTPSALEQFGGVLERHIRFEERELFATAQNRLSAEELKAVARACLPPAGDR